MVHALYRKTYCVFRGEPLENGGLSVMACHIFILIRIEISALEEIENNHLKNTWTLERHHLLRFPLFLL